MDAGPAAPPRPPALRVRRCLRRPWRFTRIGPAAPRMSGWPGEVGQVRPRRRTPGGGSDSAARAPGVRALISTLGGLPGLGGADQPGDRPAGRSRVGGGAGGHRVGAPHRPPALRGCRSATKMSHFQALKMSRSGAGRIGGRMDRVEFRGRPPAPKPGEGVECETDPLHRPARRGRVGGGAGGHRAGAALGLRRSGGSGVCIGLRAVQPISAGCAPVDRPGGRGRVAAAGPVDSERGLRSRGPDFRTAVRGERRPPAARCRGAARSLSRSPDGGLRARPAAATTGFENRATATGPARFGLAVAWRFEAPGSACRRTPARRCAARRFENPGYATGHAPLGLAAAGAAGSSLAVRPAAAHRPPWPRRSPDRAPPAPPPGAIVSGSGAAPTRGRIRRLGHWSRSAGARRCRGRRFEPRGPACRRTPACRGRAARGIENPGSAARHPRFRLHRRPEHRIEAPGAIRPAPRSGPPPRSGPLRTLHRIEHPGPTDPPLSVRPRFGAAGESHAVEFQDLSILRASFLRVSSHICYDFHQKT